MVDLESDAFPFIAESNAGFSTSNGLGGISDFDSNGPFGVSLDRLSSQESSRKMTSTSPSSSSFVLTTSTNAAAADPVMPSTSRNSSSNFLDELCGVGNGGTMQQQQNRSSQENEYLKELTELLQDTLSRPDSSLRNVEKSMLMDLVKRLKQQSKDKPENAVQHEDVSSSGSILLASHIGPMILEYLDGFFFVMNTDGFVEFVSQNVSKYLKFDQSEMVNKPIYNFVAAEHHDLFSGLLPENMAWNLLGFGNNFDVVRDSSPKPKNNGADSLPLKQQQQRKSHRFMCQFLTNAAAECSSADILPTYQNLQVTAICLPLPSNSSGFGDEDDFHLSFNVMTESQPCLVCVARRLPERSTTNFEGCQFSFRCNKSGLILDMFLFSCLYFSSKSHSEKELKKSPPKDSKI
uniref:PAS domain-containing protein n=1 Tax=Romanomermis culicivorax TaxID=13658 RepID=A0A915HWP6_ROMCU